MRFKKMAIKIKATIITSMNITVLIVMFMYYFDIFAKDAFFMFLCNPITMFKH